MSKRIKKKLPRAKISKVKKLIRERKFLQRQEEADRRFILDSLKVAKVILPQPEVVYSPALSSSSPVADIDSKPESLRGMTLMDILLAQADGWLNEEEKKWLRTRRNLSDRHYIPSNSRGWLG